MNENRRLFLLSALSGLAGSASLAFAPTLAGAALPIHSGTDALRAVAAAGLSFHAAGPEDGRPIVIARDGGQDAASQAELATLLATQGFHVLLPTPRDGGADALGQELLDFIDSQHIPEAVFVGSGRGVHAVLAAARLRRTRVIGLVLAGGSAPAPDATPAVPIVTMASGITAQQVADAAARLARQGKWRT